MTNLDSLLLKRLRAAIGSPYRWERWDWPFRRALFLYWQEVASRRHLDGEMDNYVQHVGLLNLSAGLVEKLELEVERWRPQALTDFERLTRFLRMFRHLDKKEHDKHWLPERTPEDRIVKATIDGPAKFFPRCTLESLATKLAFHVRLSWHSIAESGTDALFTDFDFIVGASNGTPTRFVRHYLDLNNGQVHSRPILEVDKPAEAQWASELRADFGPRLWPRFDELWYTPVIDEEPVYDFDTSEDDGFETPGGGPGGLSDFQAEFGPEATWHQLYSPAIHAFTSQCMIPLRVCDKDKDLDEAWAILQRLCRWLLVQAAEFSSKERFYLIVHRHHTADPKQSRLLFAGGSWIDIRTIATAVSRNSAEDTLGYPFPPPRPEDDIFRDLPK
jgi:hypothetical protein